MVTIKHKGSQEPYHKYNEDFAYDLTAKSRELIKTSFGYQMMYKFDFQTEIPIGFGAFIIPRSSIVKTRLRLANSQGLIDSNYRGEWVAIFDIIGKLKKRDIKKIKNNEEVEGIYNVNERIVQLYLHQKHNLKFEKTIKLNSTSRNEGGFGSTNK